ncbi:MAG TPA: PA2779 family protein, partial [Patescibacteria group bacterium]|nr:PA2779 family protein [Patescibacteria group bacterium]
HLPGTEASPEDLTKVQSFLENKIVVQKLVDYGVSPEEANSKIEAMNAQDLHRLASLTDRAAAGADDGIGLLIGIAILIILVIVILKLTHKEVIIR